jgi:lysophospholipase L1-like esterase
MKLARFRRASIDEHGSVSNALLGFVAGLAALAAVVLLVYVVAAVGGSTDSAASGDVYASMGDSVAAGNGASDASTTAFAALVAAREELTLFNVAKAGATTRVVIDEQLARVLPLLGSGRVRLITISAGGNDLAALIPNAACTEDSPPEACPLDETLDGVSGRLDELLRLLRDADPSVPIVLLGYPNFFSGTGHAWEAPAGRVLPALVQRLQTTAAKYDRVVVATPSFDGRGDEPTHVNDAQFDPHPNDAGHRVIADAILAALTEIEGT